MYVLLRSRYYLLADYVALTTVNKNPTSDKLLGLLCGLGISYFLSASDVFQRGRSLYEHCCQYLSVDNLLLVRRRLETLHHSAKVLRSRHQGYEMGVGNFPSYLGKKLD